MKLLWTETAWEDYQYWVKTDPKLLKRLNQIIRDVQRTPKAGMGKPERLKGTLVGWWSRRLTREHRLVYRIKKDSIEIAACSYHYK